MQAVQFSFETPLTGGQFIHVIDVKVDNHPHVQNPANWVCCNIINKYNSDLDFIECYENTLSFITSDQKTLERITADANGWIEKLRPKPTRRYIVEGSGLLNTDQLREIVSTFAPIVQLIPRNRLRHVKRGSKFANSALVSVEGDRELPPRVSYSSLGRKRVLTFSEQPNRANKPPQRQVDETPKGWHLQGRDGKSIPVHPSPYSSSEAENLHKGSGGEEDHYPSLNCGRQLRGAAALGRRAKRSDDKGPRNRRSARRIRISARHNVEPNSRLKKQDEDIDRKISPPGLEPTDDEPSPRHTRNNFLSPSLTKPTGPALHPGETLPISLVDHGDPGPGLLAVVIDGACIERESNPPGESLPQPSVAVSEEKTAPEPVLGGDDMDLLTQPTAVDMDEPADDLATTRKRSASPTAKPPPKRLSLPLTNQQDESPSLPSSSQNEASDVASSTSSSSQNECDSQKL